MRGRREGQQDLFIIFNLEDRVPMDHPLRKIKRWADGVLAEMSRDFNRAYSHTGRPGVPPEQLLKALLLQALYAIPSESKLVEAIEYNVLYRWFVDLPMEQKAWTQEAFSMTGSDSKRTTCSASSSIAWWLRRSTRAWSVPTTSRSMAR